mmetsp:Transcript_11266/g.39151  ORF Transcript_11266/g.39151 Transcript_11266/m.39151 type:complete len:400 (+) Transcript_11266:554-1753(+)
MVAALVEVHPLIMIMSSSHTRSSHTSRASPTHAGSKDSLPSSSLSVETICAPVHFAMRRMSSLATRRHAMAPASTKYLSAMSSMPLEHSTTLTPVARIFWIRSFVMSLSRSRMRSSSLGSVTSTCTPSCILVLRRSKSTSAIFAPSTRFGMPCAARPTLMAYPSTREDSRALRPCALRMLMALTGYRTLPMSSKVCTLFMESTTSLAKKSASPPMILLLMDVRAAFISVSAPRESVDSASLSSMYLHDSFMARRRPAMIDVGWILLRTRLLARLRISDATMTTEVVPSPTSWSWSSASSTRIFAAGCSTSSSLRIVAPSLVMVTSPMSSTSILSRPTGPSEDLTMLATASTAVTFCVLTSSPEVRSPAICRLGAAPADCCAIVPRDDRAGAEPHTPQPA